MDERQLMEEVFTIYLEFCMQELKCQVVLLHGQSGKSFVNSTVVSTSTRNYPNRLGDGADVF